MTANNDKSIYSLVYMLINKGRIKPNSVFLGLRNSRAHCCILALFIYLSVGPMLLSITSSAWHKYCYLQIEWVALIFLLAWGKQQDSRGNVYLALCHDCDEQHLNKRSSICSVRTYLPAALVAYLNLKYIPVTHNFSPHERGMFCLTSTHLGTVGLSIFSC